MMNLGKNNNDCVKLNYQLHSIIDGIPSDPTSDSKLHMDTRNQREGLHLWISDERDILQEIAGLQAELTERKKRKDKNTKIRKAFSVHLTRDDARNLVEEINYRLF